MTPRAARRSPLDASQSGTAPVHFPGLEAIRALAASMVVVHHVSSAAGATAGMIATPAEVMDSGVAVFFVLSGFLIFRPFAAAIIGGHDRPRVWGFWWRRILRIVPAYWIALSVLWATGNVFLGDMWWRHYLLLQPFDRYTALVGLVAAWSLSTEVCFYLIVPPLAWTAHRIIDARSTPAGPSVPARTLGLMIVLVAVGSLGPIARATAPWWAGENRALSFQWLPTNLDLFAAGMLLAVGSVWAELRAEVGLRVATFTRKAWPWWSGAALLFVAYAYGVGGVDFAVGYQGWSWQLRQFAFTLCAVLLLIPAVFGDQGDGWLRRLWRWGPVAWVGTVSYGLYLWHVGVMERLVERPAGSRTPTDPGWPGWLSDLGVEPSFVSLLVGTFVIALMAAATSWYLVERPLQRWKAIFDGVTRRG